LGAGSAKTVRAAVALGRHSKVPMPVESFAAGPGTKVPLGSVTAAVLADQAPGQPQGIDELAAEREALAARLIERHFDAHIRRGEGATGQR
jgi:hypothetical protein